MRRLGCDSWIVRAAVIASDAFVSAAASASPQQQTAPQTAPQVHQQQLQTQQLQFQMRQALGHGQAGVLSRRPSCGADRCTRCRRAARADPLIPHPFGSMAFRPISADRYNRAATTAPLQPRRYNRAATTAPLQPRRYNRAATQISDRLSSLPRPRSFAPLQPTRAHTRRRRRRRRRHVADGDACELMGRADAGAAAAGPRDGPHCLPHADSVRRHGIRARSIAAVR
jgi:hypothetical protein